MMRSLFAGVSGLRNHQIRMDVIGNNIANVNTVAFKAGRVTFEEAFAQMVQGASRPAGDSSNVSGGTNPIQVGLGMNIGSIDMLFTQGNLENTGITTDLAIQGDAFFVVANAGQRAFTRSGNFQLDATGKLVASTNGFVVQGRMAADGVLGDGIQDIILPFGQKSAAQPTGAATLGGNLDAQAADGATRETTITVYDSSGREHELRVAFTYDEAAETWNFDIPDPTVATVDPTDDSHFLARGALAFDVNGRLNSVDYTVLDGAASAGAATPPDTLDITFDPFGTGDTQTVELSFGDGTINGLTSFASSSTAVLREQDGYTMGDLQRIGIDQTGTITGSFTNGTSEVLAQIILADFNNPSGLIRTGDNMYDVSGNSGAPVLGIAGQGSQSMITSGALEMSNVDLAQEFTNMITAQRGFQSNARVITTSDEMLQEVVQLKR